MRTILRYVPLLLFIVWAVSYAAARAVDVPTFHLDGAFQTASGLFRLDAGQLPGRDFYPYLGVAPLYALFPVFKLAGAHLAASVFSAQLMTLLATWLAVSLLWHLLFRPASFLTSLACGAAFVAVPTAVSELFGSLPRLLRFGLSPGNSLRPIRSALPYLVAGIWYFRFTRPLPASRLAIEAGLLTGIVLMWSNDFALPTAVMFAPLVLFTLGRRGQLGFKALSIYALTAAGCWLGLLVALTAGHPLELLRYNFVDVARTQWWYFAPYSDDQRIFGPIDLWRLLREEDGFPFLTLVAVSWFAYRSRKVELALLVWIGTTLFLGGALASVGGHLNGYFRAMSYWSCVLILLLVMHGLKNALSRRWTAFRNRSNARAQAIHKTRGKTTIVGWSLVACAGLGCQQLLWQVHVAGHDPNRFYVSELGGYLSAQWKEYVELARVTDGVFLEEYWGIWSAVRREFPPTPVDSLIHALGSTRDVVETALATADLVTTTRHAMSEEWQPWAVTQNFWFYDHLLSGWEPVGLSPTVVVWRRLGAVRSFPAVKCEPASDGQGYTLPSASPGFFRVRLTYDLPKSGRFLLLARNNISEAAGSNGYVSLDLPRSSSTFPLRVKAGKSTTYDVRLAGHAQSGFRITSCDAARIPFTHPEVLHTP